MPAYEIRTCDPSGQVTGVTTLDSADDGAAIAEMTTHAWAPEGGGLELWRGDHCVMVGYLSGESAEPFATGI